LVQCKKDKSLTPDNPYGLPNATQSGANTFACRVNNINFIANGKQGYPPLIGAQLVSDTLSVGGAMSRSVTWTLVLQINRGLIQGKAYNLDNITQSIRLIADSSVVII
jgi:hypothetical protein